MTSIASFGSRGIAIRQAWSNKAGPVTLDQVNAVLTATKAHTNKWVAAELEKIPESEGAAAGAELTLEQLHAKLKALPPEKLKEVLKDIGK